MEVNFDFIAISRLPGHLVILYEIDRLSAKSWVRKKEDGAT